MTLQVLKGAHLFSLAPFNGKTVAILGYGKQGRAQALNMRESGVNVVIGARPGGTSHKQAVADEFAVRGLGEAAGSAELVIIALPDTVQGGVYREEIAPVLRPGSTVGFLHGYAIRFGLVQPSRETGVIMVAPKGPGTTLRERFQAGHGIPALLAVDQENAEGTARSLALAWAGAIGCGRAVVIETTLGDETETDLFGEQAVLCGGLAYVMHCAFDTLVASGYPAELAYIEVCHELKQIADLVYREGPAGMMRHISPTAEFGAHFAGPKIADEQLREVFSSILMSIQNGAFARQVQADAEMEHSWLRTKRERFAEHGLEQAGAALRPLLVAEPGQEKA